MVEKVLFDGIDAPSGISPWAVAVELSTSHEGPKYRVRANREVIICGGSVASPQLLMVSGIGPQKEISRLGIPVVVNIPAVGQHLLDVSTTYRPPSYRGSLCPFCTASQLWPSHTAHQGFTKADLGLPWQSVIRSIGISQVVVVRNRPYGWSCSARQRFPALG